MLLSELEEWRVILKSEQSIGERKYVANPNFVEMIVRVMERRESDMLDQVVLRLNTIKETASISRATPEQIESIQKMVDLAKMVRQVVTLGQKSISKHQKYRCFSKLLTQCYDYSRWAYQDSWVDRVYD